ncbi:MAG: IS5 family transposase [Candidatus Nitrosocosmicus sp.]
MTGSNPADRSKLGTKRHILTDKNGIPLSVIISSASTHDIKAVTDVIDNSVIHRPSESSFTKKKTRRTCYHLCLDKAYSSKSTENEIIRRGYVPHIPYKRKRGQKKELITYQHKHQTIKNKRWVVERTNSWHNRFRKLFTQYEKKVENYLGLVQLSSSIIIYRKIILG